MSTYSEHEQRLLDQQSGAELDRQAERREAKTSNPVNTALDLAILFHDTYERLAPQFGYETRPETRKFSPSSPNGQLMRAVCEELLKALRSPVETTARRSELREALSALESMYSHAWDRVDGALVMLPDSIVRFEAAHLQARTALGIQYVRDEEEEHPERFCERCKGPNIVWFAPSPLWNAAHGDWDILCPVCFVQLAEAAGISKLAWQIEPEGDALLRVRGVLSSLDPYDAGIVQAAIDGPAVKST